MSELVCKQIPRYGDRGYKGSCGRGRVAYCRISSAYAARTIEARYTTNKSILPKTLLDEMRESFKRSEEFLDLKAEYDPVEKTKEEVKDNIEKLTRSACKGANACQDSGRL